MRRFGKARVYRRGVDKLIARGWIVVEKKVAHAAVRPEWETVFKAVEPTAGWRRSAAPPPPPNLRRLTAEVCFEKSSSFWRGEHLPNCERRSLGRGREFCNIAVTPISPFNQARQIFRPPDNDVPI
jgi:hypothetical protein